tara:strand:- start:6416 stop:6787 length:372 start_codon:yes stop_codon:yes gene_type:complete
MESFKNSIDKTLKELNENKYFIGCAMLLVNIGARFIIDELDDETRSYISNTAVRKIFIFCSLFMATRDIFTSFILTIVFAVVLNQFLAKDEENIEENEEKDGSFNRIEIENAIQKLKSVQINL